MSDDWDWEDETHEVPNLLEIESEMDEKRKQMLLERQLVEESDAVLVEDLFGSNKVVEKKLIEQPKKPHVEQKVKHFQRKKEFQDKKALEIRKEIKKKKDEKKRQEELYGDAELDEYDEKYGDIEEMYR